MDAERGTVKVVSIRFEGTDYERLMAGMVAAGVVAGRPVKPTDVFRPMILEWCDEQVRKQEREKAELQK